MFVSFIISSKNFIKNLESRMGVKKLYLQWKNECLTISCSCNFNLALNKSEQIKKVGYIT